MNYEDRMNMLYADDAMARISDRDEISVPITATLNGKPADAMLIWYQDERADVKKLIGVFKQSAVIVEMNEDEIRKTFGVSNLSYKAPDTTDVDKYYDSKERYEELYSEMTDDESLYSKYGEEVRGLLAYLFGEDMLENLLTRIAGEYVNGLRTANTQTDSDPNPKRNTVI